MIRLHVSAVCRIRDGYTGEPVEAASLLCTLDGLPVRPLAKPGGYLVLLDLTAGEHRLALRGHGYQEEWVDIRVGAGTQELEVTMKPGPGYPFRGAVTRMELTVTRDQLPLSRQQLWLAVPAQYELKVAQTKAAAGEEQFRIYCKGPQAAVQPGAYLIVDGTDSEIVSLRELAGELAILAAPLRRSHSRSRRLLPAQCYHTDPDGRLTAVLQGACTLEVYEERSGAVTSLTLEQGENRREIQW